MPWQMVPPFIVIGGACVVAAYSMVGIDWLFGMVL